MTDSRGFKALLDRGRRLLQATWGPEGEAEAEEGSIVFNRLPKYTKPRY